MILKRVLMITSLAITGTFTGVANAYDGLQLCGKNFPASTEIVVHCKGATSTSWQTMPANIPGDGTTDDDRCAKLLGKTVMAWDVIAAKTGRAARATCLFDTANAHVGSATIDLQNHVVNDINLASGITCSSNVGACAAGSTLSGSFIRVTIAKAS